MPSDDAPFTAAFLATKIADIGLTGIYFFVLGIFFAKLFDVIYGKFDKNNYGKQPLFWVFLEIVGHLFLISVVAYALRNIVERIPSPFDGLAGFQHKRLKELEGGHIMAVVLVLFQKNLHDKIKYFVSRLF